jgi:hypothetical protein
MAIAASPACFLVEIPIDGRKTKFRKSGYAQYSILLAAMT